jgi:hypothetical protein
MSTSSKSRSSVISIAAVCGSILVLIGAIFMGYKTRYKSRKMTLLPIVHRRAYPAPGRHIPVDPSVRVDPGHRAMQLHVPKPVFGKKSKLGRKGKGSGNGQAPEIEAK